MRHVGKALISQYSCSKYTINSVPRAKQQIIATKKKNVASRNTAETVTKTDCPWECSKETIG